MRGTLMLLGASFFWGTTFVAQVSGMEGLGPFSYAASRFFLGFLSLLIVLFVTRKSRRRERLAGKYGRGFLPGFLIGTLIFAASSLQQISMLYTTAGKAAFITCLYIIFTPLGERLLGKKIRAENWVGAFLAMTGLYFLAVSEEFTINFGDLILFFSAFFWTAQILLVGKFASKTDVVEFSVGQTLNVTLLSFVAMMIFENPTWAAIKDAAFPIFYGGVMSAGVAFTLQIYGQKYASPSTAAILMSFEAIFGALSGWLLLGEEMNFRQVCGCGLMLAGIFAAQFRTILGKK